MVKDKVKKLIVLQWVLFASIFSGQAEAEFEIDLKEIPEEIQLIISSDKGNPADHFYTLLHKKSINIEEDVLRERNYRVDRFSNAENMQKYGQSSISYNEYAEKIIIHRAAAINDSGDITHIEPEDIKIIDNNTYDIFSSHKEILINFRGISKYGYIYLDFERVVTINNLESDWMKTVYPQELMPKKEFGFSVSWSANREPSVSIQSNHVDCIREEFKLQCKGVEIPSAPDDEAWYWQDEIGFIQVGELSTWFQVKSNYSSLFGSAMSPVTGEILDEVLESKGLSMEDKISRLHEFVARDIRYLSRSEHGHAVTPHATAETFETRQGDCKDKSALLMQLLNEIGLTSYPVLVNTGKKKIAKKMVPSLRQFNHVIVCFIYEGHEYCIDATDKNTSWKILSEWIQGAYALRIKDDASGPFVLPVDSYKWEMAIDTYLTFMPDGGQRETQKRTYRGHYGAWLKGYLNITDPKEVIASLKDDYASIVSDLGIPEFDYQGHQDIGTDVVINSSVTLEPFLNVGEELSYNEGHVWLKKEVDELIMDNNHYARQIYGIDMEETVTVDMNEQWHIIVPPAKIDFQHEYGSLVREVKLTNGNKLEMKIDLKIPSRVVSIDEKEKFNRFLSRIMESLNFYFYALPEEV